VPKTSNIPKQEVPFGHKNQLGKRPHDTESKRPHHESESKRQRLETPSLSSHYRVLKQQTSSNQLPKQESSRKYVTYQSQSSSRSVHESKVSFKRAFSSMSDGQLTPDQVERDNKLRKFEGAKSMPSVLEQTIELKFEKSSPPSLPVAEMKLLMTKEKPLMIQFEEISPRLSPELPIEIKFEKSSPTPMPEDSPIEMKPPMPKHSPMSEQPMEPIKTSPQSFPETSALEQVNLPMSEQLIAEEPTMPASSPQESRTTENDSPQNIVNVKLTLLPKTVSPNDPYVMLMMQNAQQSSESSESLSQEEIATFKQEISVGSERSDFNSNAELIAGCELTA
jgi:hypothetical protein